MAPHPDGEPEGDAVLVLRVWVQAPDGAVVGRLLTAADPDGVVAVGVEGITALVRVAVRNFVGAHRPPGRPDRDAPATPPERPR